MHWLPDEKNCLVDTFWEQQFGELSSASEESPQCHQTRNKENSVSEVDLARSCNQLSPYSPTSNIFESGTTETRNIIVPQLANIATVAGVQPKANWAPLSIGPQLFQTRAWKLPSDLHAMARFTWWQDNPQKRARMYQRLLNTRSSGRSVLSTESCFSKLWQITRWPNWVLTQNQE